MMTKLIFLFLLLTLVTSCATFLNTNKTKLTLQTETPHKTIRIPSLDTIIISPATLEVKRSKNDLILYVDNDTIAIKRKFSTAFTLGNLVTGFPLLGYTIDLFNIRRFTYPKEIFINDSLKKKKYYTFIPTINKPVNLVLSFPYLNQFYCQTNTGTASKTGFIGIALGFESYYSPKNYISMKIGSALDHLVPVPAPVRYDSIHEKINSTFINLQNNHQIRHFHLGYGLNYSKYTWRKYDETLTTNSLIDSKNNQSLGLNLSTYYLLGKHFYFGLLYQAQLLSFNTLKAFQYQHLISFDFGLKIKLRDNKK